MVVAFLLLIFSILYSCPEGTRVSFIDSYDREWYDN